MCVAEFGLGEAVRLVDRDRVQPAEESGAVGLAAQKDRPCALARVFDQFGGSVDRARDGAQEAAVMTTVQLGLVATLRCGSGGGCHGGLRSVGAACAPTHGRAAPARTTTTAVWRPVRESAQAASCGIAIGWSSFGVLVRMSSAFSILRAIVSIVSAYSRIASKAPSS